MTNSPDSSEQQKPQQLSRIHPKEYDQENQKIIVKTKSRDISDEQSKQIAELNKLLDKLVPQLKGWHKLAFILLGIASLAGWNAILSAIDFFQAQYPKSEFYDVTLFFPVPIMLTNCLAAFICPALARYFSVNARIAYCLMGTCFTMISVSLIAIFFNTQAGFWISVIILIIQGFIDSVNTSSLISLAGMLHPSLNNIYWTCTALSGLTTNFLRMITLGMLGNGDASLNTGSALYFSIAAFVYVVSSTLQVLFTNSEYFHIILKRQKVYSKIEQIKKLSNSAFDLQKMQTAQNMQQAKLDILNQKKKDNSFRSFSFIAYFIELCQVFKYAGAIPIFISINYIQTFMMFPGVSIFQKTTYEIITYPWAPVVMITIFNLGDIIGKHLGFFKVLHKLYFIYGVVIFRFIYFALFLITAKRKDLEIFQNDFFAMINIFVFAVTNGLSTTALINLGTKNTKDPQMIDLINYFGGFAIAFGIMIGTFVALTLNNSEDYEI